MLKLIGNILRAIVIVAVLTGFRPQAMLVLAIICIGVGVVLAPFYLVIKFLQPPMRLL